MSLRETVPLGLVQLVTFAFAINGHDARDRSRSGSCGNLEP
ncbi:MAG: hypothetical protein SFW67_09590 [Myxococcaceae bacterium]|nr:hypothetical protein [Myxococcaceae bacterium]